MKALVYTGPETLDYRETPDPEPGRDALIRVAHVSASAAPTCTPGPAMTNGAPRR